MGAQFAAAVSEYLTSVGEEARGIGVIKSNPEQSKHLETATMRVGSCCIAFHACVSSPQLSAAMLEPARTVTGSSP